MDPDSLRLRVLWSWPQLPKKKIKRFMQLGDEYRKKGDETMARYCYKKSLQLAKAVQAVHLEKKIEERVFQ